MKRILITTAFLTLLFAGNAYAQSYEKRLAGLEDYVKNNPIGSKNDYWLERRISDGS